MTRILIDIPNFGEPLRGSAGSLEKITGIAPKTGNQRMTANGTELKCTECQLTKGTPDLPRERATALTGCESSKA